MFESARAGRWDDAAAQLAGDFLRVDNRTGVADATAVGPDAYLTAFRAALEVGFTTVAVEHLAVRGDRLCLLRSTFTADSGSELVIVSVYEIDADGRGSYLSLHDPDDLAAALDELESRYHEIRADVPRIAEEGFRREKEAFDRGDWEAVRACYSPAFCRGRPPAARLPGGGPRRVRRTNRAR